MRPGGRWRRRGRRRVARLRRGSRAPPALARGARSITGGRRPSRAHHRPPRRSGRVARAGMIDEARATCCGRQRGLTATAELADLRGEVALAVADLGAPASARRAEVLRGLEDALAAVEGVDPDLEARLTARLARELQHSVAADRPRAGPPERAGDRPRSGRSGSRHAPDLPARPPRRAVDPGTSRRSGSSSPGRSSPWPSAPATTSAWRRGTCSWRTRCSRAARRPSSRRSRRAFGCSIGSASPATATPPPPGERRCCCSGATSRPPRPPSRTLQPWVASIREPDAENVRMSQRLELVRARAAARRAPAVRGGGDRALDRSADELARHRRRLLRSRRRPDGGPPPRGDRRRPRVVAQQIGRTSGPSACGSSPWPPIALDDRPLCEELLADLAPIAATCGVNGAVVAFAGSHGHVAGLLATHLGEPRPPPSSPTLPRSTNGSALPRSSPSSAAQRPAQATAAARAFPELTAREEEVLVAHRPGQVERRDRGRAGGQPRDRAQPHHPDLPEAAGAHAARRRSSEHGRQGWYDATAPWIEPCGRRSGFYSRFYSAARYGPAWTGTSGRHRRAPSQLSDTIGDGSDRAVTGFESLITRRS